MSEDMQSLLSAYKAEVEQSVPDRERDWGRLVQRIDAGTEPLPVDLEPPARRRWLPWALGAAAAVALATWGLTRVGWGTPAEQTGGAHMAVDEAGSRGSERAVEVQPPTASTSVRRQHSRAPEAEPEPNPEPEPLAEVEPEPQSETEPEREHRRRVRPSRATSPEPEPESKPAPSESPIVAEARSIRRIRAALRDGRGKAALERVAAHERAFPKGTLTDELAVLEADALCQLGRAGDARKVAAAFVRRRPASPLAARARRICTEP